MTARRLRLSLLPALAVGIVFCGLARAQVPEGSAVVGTYFSTTALGTPGLFLVNLQTGAVTPITGLPAELTTSGISQLGTWSVTLRSSDGAVIVGTIGGSGGAVNVHVLHLNGAAVARTQTIYLGTAAAGTDAAHGNQSRCCSPGHHGTGSIESAPRTAAFFVALGYRARSMQAAVPGA